MKLTHTSKFSESRRSFLQQAGLGALALSLPFSAIPASLRGVGMGVVVHSYWSRWQADTSSQKYPGFQNALQLLEHCHQIGAGGVQVGVKGWTEDFAKKVRDRREALDMYLEGSISLPKSEDQVLEFEKEVMAAKEAGATVLRTACLSGRRYENFDSESQYADFKKDAITSIQRAEPIVRKHRILLAVENHKDWLSEELVAIIQSIDSEWVGVTLDFGNNVSLLEHPMTVIRNLAPYSFSTHVKDMAVKEYEEGFLLSEVPLGEGIVDLEEAVKLCQNQRPGIRFSLEMITRDPLQVPCLTEKYWQTFGQMPAPQLAASLALVREKSFSGDLPKLTGLSQDQKFENEENNILSCLDFSKKSLGLG
ncbi:sugar phosphate isomerase/epimerase family protein [Algoriphagus namhaensis]